MRDFGGRGDFESGDSPALGVALGRLSVGGCWLEPSLRLFLSEMGKAG